MPITKGPWRVEEDIRSERTGDMYDLENGYSEYLAGYNIISDEGDIVGIEGIIPGGNSLDNAQAIAALPELVEVLLPFAAMADVADEYGHGPGSTCEWRMSYDDFARARALLARLEGL